MKRIALLAQNRHDAESARLIAGEVRRQGWAQACFVSLDAFFQQSARESFAGEPIDLEEVVPRRQPPAPFYRLSRLARLRIVLENQRRLARLAGDFDALVAGCDGALERVLINSLRRRRRPTYLVINALHFGQPESPARVAAKRLTARLRLNHLFFSELGQGMCQRIFAPGDHSRRQLLELGVTDDRIEVTGSPRFAELFRPDRDPGTEILDRLGGAEPLRLLYLVGAWEWHGRPDQAEREIEQVERCAEAASGWPGRLELVVRLHPRSTSHEKRRLEAVSGARLVSAERPLRDDLDATHVVLTSVSTGMLEAIARGRLVLVADLNGIGQGLDLRAFEESGMWLVTSGPALRSAFEEILAGGPELARRVSREVGSLAHFMASQTPQASRRIVERIRKDLDA